MARLANPLKLDDGVKGEALFSPCGRYRFLLTRFFVPEPKRLLAVIGMNPSRADEHADDRTLKIVQKLARRERFDGVIMLNLWAYRATDSAEMREWYRMPRMAWWDTELKNERLVTYYTGLAEYTICAWGADKTGKSERLLNVLRNEGRDLRHLGLRKSGHPRHPLYTRNDVEIQTWETSDSPSRP